MALAPDDRSVATDPGSAMKAKLALKIAVALLAVLGAAAGGLLIFLNTIIAAQRERIVAEVGRAAGRPVQIATISASVWGRPGIELGGVAVADDPRFGPPDFVRAEVATVRLRLWPLLHGRLEVARVQLTRPVIRVVRAANGELNYASLRRPLTTAPGAPAAGDGAGLEWLVAIFDIDDGTVLYVDRTVTPERTTTLHVKRLTASDIALDRPVAFSFRGGLDSDTDNLTLDGSAGPASAAGGVPLHLTGAIGPIGPPRLKIEEIDVTAVIRPDAVDISAARCSLFQGHLSGSGHVALAERGRSTLRGAATDVNVREVVAMRTPEVADEIEGRAQMDVDLAVVGSDWNSLTGTINASVADGTLRNFNLLAEVVNRAAALPGAPKLLGDNVKPKYAKVLHRPDTRFSSLRATLRAGGGQLRAEVIDIAAEDYGAEASGVIGFDLNADIRGTLVLSPAFSADVAQDVREAKYLFDAQQRVALPWRYRGHIGEARPQPDLGQLSSVLERAIADGAAERLLNKLFGNKSGTPSGGTLGDRLRSLLGP